ncbi:hypothetical protein IJJ12_00985, partial [bacterium]|nr:hypothetical protein [bacterium]
MSKKTDKAAQLFLRRSAMYSLASAVANFLALIFNWLMVRHTSTAVYGEYASINAYMMLLSLPLSVGQLQLTKWVASQKDRKVHLAWLRTRSQMWRGLAIALILIMAWLYAGANFVSAWSPLVVVWWLGCSGVSAVVTAVLAGREKFGTLSGVTLVTMVARVATGAIMLRGSVSMNTMLWCFVMVGGWQAVTYGYGWYRQWRQDKRRSETTTEMALVSWRMKDWWLPAVVTLVSSGMLYVDVAVAKLVLDSEAAGVYAVASLLAKVLWYAATPLINVAYTEFVRANDRQRQTVRLWSTGLLVALTVTMTLAYKLWSEFIIRVVSSSAYLSLAPVLFLSAI